MPDCMWMAAMCALSLSVLSFAQPPSASEAPPATGFLYKTVKIDGQTCAYCVFVPPDYTPERAWPVILFLHGSGERGEDGFLQTDVGIGRALRRHRHLIPAIVVMPQCRPNQIWAGPMAQLALRCVEETSREYHLDPQRLYLTGLSLGAHGALHLAAEHPDRFAAIISVCGFAELGQSTGLASRLARRLTGVPVWFFHGQQDTNVPVIKSRELVAAFRQAGGQVQYTEYPDGDHCIWDRVYDSREVWNWLFEQKRSPAGPDFRPPEKQPEPTPAETRPAADSGGHRP
jgi:predicted peptidase